jgi:transposase
MELEEFWEVALGPEDPWRVADVEYRMTDGEREVHIRMEVPAGVPVRCPVCGSLCKAHDRVRDRTWRDADFRGMRTYIHADIPRADCPEHGIRQTDIPWSRPGSGFTLLMESMIVSMARQMPVKAVGDMIGEYDGKIWRVVRAYVERLVAGLDLSGVRRVAVDEKSFRGRQEYITVFADPDTGRVIFATEGKDADAVKRFKDFFTEHGGRPKKVTDFSCDFGKAYISGIRKHFKKARITGDRFHLVKMANTALNEVKCEEIKLTVNRTRAKFLLLTNTANMSEGDMRLRDDICRDNEVLGLAYRMKEALCMVYHLRSPYLAATFLKSWIKWAKEAGLRSFMRLAKTVEEHISHILQWFTSRLTNALMEGTNSLISVIKSRARGFWYAENLISMCYLVSAQEKTDMYGRGV